MLSQQLAKRAIDVVLCLAGAPLVLPLCLLLVLAVRLESAGPGLFIQKRVGRHGRPFRMLKIRTMLHDTGDMPSHEAGASRITRLGGLLRKLKLDELPQLLNVLGGSMSLVGPRPSLLSQIELIEARRALGVLGYRPGVTGPAQILGVDMSEPVRLAQVEAAYFASAGIWSDLRLIVGTVLGRGIGDAALRQAGERAPAGGEISARPRPSPPGE